MGLIVSAVVLIIILPFLILEWVHKGSGEIALSSIILSSFIIIVIFCCYKFIYWLFIEPFRKKNK